MKLEIIDGEEYFIFEDQDHELRLHFEEAMVFFPMDKYFQAVSDLYKKDLANKNLAWRVMVEQIKRLSPNNYKIVQENLQYNSFTGAFTINEPATPLALEDPKPMYEPREEEPEPRRKPIISIRLLAFIAIVAFMLTSMYLMAHFVH